MLLIGIIAIEAAPFLLLLLLVLLPPPLPAMQACPDRPSSWVDGQPKPEGVLWALNLRVDVPQAVAPGSKRNRAQGSRVVSPVTVQLHSPRLTGNSGQCA